MFHDSGGSTACRRPPPSFGPSSVFGTTRSGDDSVFTASGSPPQIAPWEAADRDGSDRISTSSATGVAWAQLTANNVTPPSSNATATASSTGRSPNAPVS